MNICKRGIFYCFPTVAIAQSSPDGTRAGDSNNFLFNKTIISTSAKPIQGPNKGVPTHDVQGLSISFQDQFLDIRGGSNQQFQLSMSFKNSFKEILV